MTVSSQDLNVSDDEESNQSLEKQQQQHQQPIKSNSERKVSPAIGFLRNIVIYCAAMIVVFWIIAAQTFGLFGDEQGYVKKAHVAVVDFDGAGFGTALLSAASQYNQTKGYPTYILVDPMTTSTTDLTHRVFMGEYWAALYVMAGSTQRFEQAINGSGTEYLSNQTFAYITMEARYYQMYVTYITSTCSTVSQAAANLVGQIVTVPRLSTTSFSTTSAASLMALAVPAEPIQVYAAGGQDFSLDDKDVANTVGMVLLIVMQAFFVIASNVNAMHNGLFKSYSLKKLLIARYFAGFLWPLIASLCGTGWTFAFRGSYPLTTKMWFAFWAVSWVFSMISLDILDLFACYAPPHFVALFIIFWIISNLAGSLGTSGLLNNWYRVLFFWPSTHWWETCITILTNGGGEHKLHYTLPTLAGWLIFGKIGCYVGMKSKVNKAQSGM